MRHVARLLALMLVGLVMLPIGAATAATDDRPVVRVGTEGDNVVRTHVGRHSSTVLLEEMRVFAKR